MLLALPIQCTCLVDQARSFAYQHPIHKSTFKLSPILPTLTTSSWGPVNQASQLPLMAGMPPTRHQCSWCHCLPQEPLAIAHPALAARKPASAIVVQVLLKYIRCPHSSAVIEDGCHYTTGGAVIIGGHTEKPNSSSFFPPVSKAVLHWPQYHCLFAGLHWRNSPPQSSAVVSPAASCPCRTIATPVLPLVACKIRPSAPSPSAPAPPHGFQPFPGGCRCFEKKIIQLRTFRRKQACVLPDVSLPFEESTFIVCFDCGRPFMTP